MEHWPEMVKNNRHGSVECCGLTPYWQKLHKNFLLKT